MRSSLRRTMWGQVGLIRSRESLIRATAQLARWEQMVSHPLRGGPIWRSRTWCKWRIAWRKLRSGEKTAWAPITDPIFRIQTAGLETA